MENITVAVFRHNQARSVESIPRKLESFQAMVGGYIEAVTLTPDGLTLVCNEEGKLRELPVVALLRRARGGTDAICGNFFLCRTVDADFASLTPEDIERLGDWIIE